MTMVFWVNVHGSFVLGLAIALAYLVGTGLASVLGEGQLGRARLKWVGAAGASTLVATLVNPQGIGIFAYVRDLTGNQAVRAFTGEWQPPTPATPLGMLLGLSVLGLMLVLARRRERPRISEMLVLAGMLWLAWSAARNVLWYGIVVAPLFGEGLAQMRRRAVAERVERHLPWPGLGLAALIGVGLVLVQPWTVQSLTLPGAFGDRTLPPPAPPLLTTETPIAATTYLRTHPGGRLFAEMGYASYVIWAVPGQQTFVDPRMELFPSTVWADYGAMSSGDGAIELADRYGIDRILLSTLTQPGLSAALRASSRWALEYEDEAAQVWRRV
jgi:hypothetical protein